MMVISQALSTHKTICKADFILQNDTSFIDFIEYAPIYLMSPSKNYKQFSGKISLLEKSNLHFYYSFHNVSKFFRAYLL